MPNTIRTYQLRAGDHVIVDDRLREVFAAPRGANDPQASVLEVDLLPTTLPGSCERFRFRAHETICTYTVAEAAALKLEAVHNGGRL